MFVLEDIDGDPNPEAIYAAVGWALSQWETMEIRASMLFALLRGKPWDEAAMSYYGLEGRTFVIRLSLLEKAGPRFFQRHCDQEAEGDFAKLTEEMSDLAHDRHQIAHGLVSPVTYVAIPERPTEQPERWVLRSPMYSITRLSKDESRTLGFNLNAKAIRDRGTRFAEMGAKLLEFTLRLQALASR